jgi:hypothetical protein
MTAKSNCDPITLHQCEWVYDGLTGEKLVRVNGTTYRYARLPGRVELTKPTGEVYEVTRLTCTCNDAKMRRRVTGCKHRDALKRLGLLRRAAEMLHQNIQHQEAS